MLQVAVYADLVLTKRTSILPLPDRIQVLLFNATGRRVNLGQPVDTSEAFSENIYQTCQTVPIHG